MEAERKVQDYRFPSVGRTDNNRLCNSHGNPRDKTEQMLIEFIKEAIAGAWQDASARRYLATSTI